MHYRWILGAALALALLGCQREPELIDMGALQHFEGFTDTQGRPLGMEQLRGKPWVANFMFTSCPVSCPPLAEATARVQGEIEGWAPADQGPFLVTITVDPVTDTPEKLRSFGQKYGARPALWRFARAPYPKMEQAVVEGFHVPLLRSDLGRGETLEEREARLKEATPYDTAHSLHFVLVDAKGHLRGVYGREEADLERLNQALRYLWEHRGEP